MQGHHSTEFSYNAWRGTHFGWRWRIDQGQFRRQASGCQENTEHKSGFGYRRVLYFNQHTYCRLTIHWLSPPPWDVLTCEQARGRLVEGSSNITTKSHRFCKSKGTLSSTTLCTLGKYFENAYFGHINYQHASLHQELHACPALPASSYHFLLGPQPVTFDQPPSTSPARPTQHVQPSTTNPAWPTTIGQPLSICLRARLRDRSNLDLSTQTPCFTFPGAEGKTKRRDDLEKDHGRQMNFSAQWAFNTSLPNVPTL